MPDLRVRSAGASGAYAFQPLTERGRAFVDQFASGVKGTWQEGAYWFRDAYASPYVVLRASGLDVVAGIGDDDSNDVPWPEKTGYGGD